jgi:metal-responsive CopG/Arc/MetJ family transcriptional regulator
MQRALINFEDEELEKIDSLSEAQHISRSELVRRAVALYLEQFKEVEQTDEAFGLWTGEKVDGLEYQERLRAEW